EPVDHVVEAHLEHPQQVLARDPGPARGLLVVRAELLLQHAVVAAGLLLLAQLQEVLGLLGAAAPVLSGRVRAALDGALLRQAALALEEELHALATALLALGAGRPGHGGASLDPAPLARAAAIVGLRCDVADGHDLEAGGLQRAHRRLATGARPLDEDLDLLQAVL